MSTVFWNKFNIEVESSCFRLFSSIFLRLLTFDFTFWGGRNALAKLLLCGRLLWVAVFAWGISLFDYVASGTVGIDFVWFFHELYAVAPRIMEFACIFVEYVGIGFVIWRIIAWLAGITTFRRFALGRPARWVAFGTVAGFCLFFCFCLLGFFFVIIYIFFKG